MWVINLMCKLTLKVLNVGEKSLEVIFYHFAKCCHSIVAPIKCQIVDNKNN